jgi:hypothetical protein
MTTGIAIVGASVIAVAPLTAPPPELRTAEVAAVDAIRSVHSDVELTGLADALIAAVPQAVAATVTLFTSTIPASAQNLIAAGKFAHLPVLAVNAVILGTMAPVTPFLVALVNELPSPLGTLDGVIAEAWKLVFETPASTLSNVLVLMAEVIDDGLSPLDAVLGSINNLSIAIAATVESIQTIIGKLGSSAPFKTMAAAEEVDNARVGSAAASSTGQLDDPNVVPDSLDSLTLKDSTNSSTVTVDTSALKNTDEIKASKPTVTEESEPEAADKSHEPAAVDATPNGGTDLSHGNKADPGTTGEKSTGGDHDAPTAAAKDDTTVGSASDNEPTKNESNSDSAANSGGDEGSSGE